MAKPLVDAIKAVATIGPAYLLTSHGTPFSSPDSYRNWFNKRLKEAELSGLSTHGIRKAIAELLAEEGSTQHQIMAVMSHTEPSTSAIYTKGAERRALAAAAMKSVSGIEW
mmetsp:Transcript_26147/g.44574  ORF Transcript_26147/g.44574 Transcript_26147/m.44574 type:complete len:111 (+) Transcript_26147:3-335(+)